MALTNQAYARRRYQAVVFAWDDDALEWRFLCQCEHSHQGRYRALDCAVALAPVSGRPPFVIGIRELDAKFTLTLHAIARG